jgi:hypothetical protein
VDEAFDVLANSYDDVMADAIGELGAAARKLPPDIARPRTS